MIGTTPGLASADIVQARRNGWHLTGQYGNRRGPINRDHIEGERLVIPGPYVTEYLALGHASTVHTAQGRTVDTCHTVITPITAPEALYVGLSAERLNWLV